jgi:hypothetical protein
VVEVRHNHTQDRFVLVVHLERFVLVRHKAKVVRHKAKAVRHKAQQLAVRCPVACRYWVTNLQVTRLERENRRWCAERTLLLVVQVVLVEKQLQERRRVVTAVHRGGFFLVRREGLHLGDCS